MDKKILLSGAAALLMGASIFAAPASAAIEISHSGEAKLTATLKDTCVTTATRLDTDDNQTPGVGATKAAFATFLGLDYTVDDDDGGGNGDSADDIEDALDALTGGTTDLAADAAMTGNISFDSKYNCGTNVSAESPIWDVTSKLDWSASGTLANGLSVSTSQDGDLNLSGAFGSLAFKKGGDSAAKASFAGFDGDITGAGETFGGHALATAGTAGVVVTYAAPSMGGMDLYISYAPNADIAADGTPAATVDSTLDFTDTIGFGAKFATDALTISAGWESADAPSGVTCWTKDVADTGADITAAALIDKVYGTDECGDATLMVLGASMNAGGLAISGGWSELDTAEADRTTTSLKAVTTVGDYNLNIGYSNSTKSSALAGANTEQTTIGGSVSTSLGDGLDLTVKASQNKWDDNSQAVSRGGNGPTDDFYAQLEIKATY